MTTIYRLSTSELNEEFLNSVKLLFSDKEVEITIQTIDDTIADQDWLRSLNGNQVFDFLRDEEEDIYSISDGKPLTDEG